MNDGDGIFIGLLFAGAACVLVILIDGWFFRPRRDPGASSADEPLLPKLAGYALVGLSLGGAFNAGTNRLTVDAGVDNLLNTGYQDVLNVYRAFGIEMPGRNYFMKVSIPFGS